MSAYLPTILGGKPAVASTVVSATPVAPNRITAVATKATSAAAVAYSYVPNIKVPYSAVIKAKLAPYMGNIVQYGVPLLTLGVGYAAGSYVNTPEDKGVLCSLVGVRC